MFVNDCRRRLRKSLLVRVVIACAAASTCGAGTAAEPALPADPEQFHIFLLMGQSNMAGYGAVVPTDPYQPGDTDPVPGVFVLDGQGTPQDPAPVEPIAWRPAAHPLHLHQATAKFGLGLDFAKVYREAQPGVTVGLVPCAWGGTSINGLSKGRSMYENAIRRALVAKEQGRLKGVLWHQGESDTVAAESVATYEGKLRKLIADVRADCGVPDLPFVIGNLAEFYGVCPDHSPRIGLINRLRGILHTVATTEANAAFVPSTGLESPDANYVHFNRDSSVEFGKRYARALADLNARAAKPADATGSGASPKPATIVILGDTQTYYFYNHDGHPYCRPYPHVDYFGIQTRWIRDHAAAENIVFVTHVGDIVDAAMQVEWQYADRSMRHLDGAVPYSATFGNHDGGAPNAFGTERYQGRPWYVGGSPDRLAHAQTFEAAGITCLHLNLPWAFKPAHVTWAQGIIDKHPGRPTLITTHNIMDENRAGRSGQGEQLWKGLVEPNPQVFLIAAGHNWPSRHETGTTADGRRVIQIQCDYQELAEGGAGFLKKVVLDPAAGQIRVQAYSPAFDVTLTDHHGTYAYAADFRDGRIVVGEEISPPRRIWTGGGATTKWSEPANWGGTTPAAGDLVFLSAAHRQPSVNDLPPGTRIAGLVLMTGVPGNLAVSGNPLVLAGDITSANWENRLATLGMPLVLEGDRQINSGACNMRITGRIDGTGSLTKTGGADYIDGYVYGWRRRDGGELVLEGEHGYTGRTTVVSGAIVLECGTSSNPIASSPAIALHRNAVLKVRDLAAGTLALAPGQRLAGLGTVLGGVKAGPRATVATGLPGVALPGTLTVDGGLEFGAESGLDVTLDDGTVPPLTVTDSLAIDPAAKLTLTTGSLALEPGAARVVIDVTGAVPIAGEFAGVNLGGNARLSHRGGDGNDVVVYVPAASAALPTITKQPASVATTTGSVELLRVVATGGPIVGYQWQTSGDGGATWADVPGGTVAVLALPAAGLGDDGRRYRCRVSNEAGAVVSAPATLSVFRPTDGKAVYLPFDGSLAAGPGTTRAATAALGTPRFAAGRLGEAAAFANAEGAAPNDWLASLGRLDEIYAGSFSVALWVKADRRDGAGALLGNKNWASGGNVGWVLSLMKGKNVNWAAEGGPRHDVGVGFVDDVWHHVAVVFDRGRNEVATYLDGKRVKVRGLSETGAEALATGLDTLVGGSGGGGFAGAGLVDDLAIWSRPLLEAEVVLIHAKGAEGVPLGELVKHK